MTGFLEWILARRALSEVDTRSSGQEPEHPPTSVQLVQEVRAAGEDVHHGWRQRRAIGDSQALEEVIESARRMGASEEEVAELRKGYPQIGQELIRKRGDRFRRRSLAETRRAAVDPGPTRKALPPGDIDPDPPAGQSVR
jgi:hypothetical protein